MAFEKRNIRKLTDLPYSATGFVQHWAYASADSLATMLTAGYFNDLRDRLKVNDTLHLTASAGGVGDFMTVHVTSIPASPGDIVLAGDDDQASVVAARAVVPTDDGLTTGLLLASDGFVSVTSANAAYWLTLPAIADVPLGKEIWGKIGATACEMRTPAASNTKINGTDGDTTESIIAANCTFMAKKVAADEWVLVTYAPGAVAAPVPD